MTLGALRTDTTTVRFAVLCSAAWPTGATVGMDFVTQFRNEPHVHATNAAAAATTA